MLATQFSAATTRKPVSLPLVSIPAWKQIIGSAEPFLQAVGQCLAEQIQALIRKSRFMPAMR